MAASTRKGKNGLLPGRDTIGPLALMLSTPVFAMVFFHVNSHDKRGDFASFGRECRSNGVLSTVAAIWPDPFDPVALRLIAAFMIFELALMRFVPGKTFRATVTPGGHTPVYTANGMTAYLLTLATLLLLAHFDLFRPSLVYDKFGEILSSMNLLALLFCALLLVKGRVSPSSSPPDSGSNGSLLMDFYWGMELYPRVWGMDVKLFTNCRCGMMFWAVSILCFAHKHIQLNDNNTLQLSMAVNVALQLVYISKFFYWEMGYMCSMDIQHDRAGYYICWGCLVWVPSIYTSTSFYLVQQHHASHLSIGAALGIFGMGLLMIWINYDSDYQRFIFRQTNGNCLIWGHTPRRIVAEYTLEGDGEVRKSLLLVDGWWKISRHFHYLPEILASLCWTLPVGTAAIGPYFYVAYLTILLVDRAFRDDAKCREKYGVYWETYCQEVPFMILPFFI